MIVFSQISKMFKRRRLVFEEEEEKKFDQDEWDRAARDLHSELLASETEEPYSPTTPPSSPSAPPSPPTPLFSPTTPGAPPPPPPLPRPSKKICWTLPVFRNGHLFDIYITLHLSDEERTTKVDLYTRVERRLRRKTYCFDAEYSFTQVDWELISRLRFCSFLDYVDRDSIRINSRFVEQILRIISNYNLKHWRVVEYPQLAQDQ